MKKKKLDFKLILIVLVVVSVLFNLVFVGKSAYIGMKGKIYKKAYQQASADIYNGIYQNVSANGQVELVYNDQSLKLSLTEENEEI